MKFETIKKKKDFVKLAKAKKFLRSRNFIIQYDTKINTGSSSDKSSDIKLGITVSKKLGNAVSRNLVKRRIRSLVFNTFSKIDFVYYRYVIIARKYLINTNYKSLMLELNYIIRKINQVKK